MSKEVELLLHEISGVIGKSKVGAICAIVPVDEYSPIHAITNVSDEAAIKMLRAALRRFERGRLQTSKYTPGTQ